MSNCNDEKMKKAINAYLAHKGAEQIEWHGDWLAFVDEGDMVIADVAVRWAGNSDEHPIEHCTFEERFMSLVMTGAVDKGCFDVRYDILTVMVIDEDRALLRHHVNAPIVDAGLALKKEDGAAPEKADPDATQDEDTTEAQ